jgi:hypothetical protein
MPDAFGRICERCWEWPACRWDADILYAHSRTASSQQRVAVPANASGLARMRILTLNSRSWRGNTPYGARCAHRARICSGSLDRPVLGHLCTEWPLAASVSIARARKRSCGCAHRAAGHHDQLWGAAGKQRQISSTSAPRAPASRKQHFLRATEALCMPLVSSVDAAALALTSHSLPGLLVCSSACRR